MAEKLRKLYYSPRGYWKGLAAIKKLTAAAGVGRKTYKYALTVVDAASRYKGGQRGRDCP